MSALIVGFAGRAVEVVVHGDPLDRLVRHLFAAVPPWPGVEGAHIRLSLHTMGRGVLCVEGVERHQLADGGSAAEWVMGRVIHHLADRATDGLFVHGAVVGPAEGAVVVGGASGAGKTTLTAWLVAVAGLAHRTDEVAYVRQDGELLAFHRPFNIKASGWGAVEALATGEPAESDLVWAHGRMLAPSRFGAVAEPGPCRPGALLFPVFDPSAERATWTALSPADGAAQLVGCTVNARNLADGGLGLAMRVAAGCRAWSLRYGGFDQLDVHGVRRRLGARGG